MPGTVQGTAPRRTVRYAGVSGVAQWFGVQPETVTKWLTRYGSWPEPDGEIDRGPGVAPERGWLPGREQEWRDWKDSLPGQGAPGKAKPRQARQDAGRQG